VKNGVLIALSFCASTVLLAAPAAAQSSIGLRGYGSYGSTALAATETFEAVAGTATRPNVGGGAVVAGLWRGVFVDVGVSQLKLDGERVFVDGGTAYSLGIPLQVTLRPIDVAAGWRLTTGRFSPYVGGGISSLSYEETSAFAQAGDDLKARKSGPLFLAGVDARLVKWVHIGGELRYRAIKGILGAAGASEAFGEDEIGGMSAGIRFSIGR
jgi:opacity protein-like surface antigen